MDIIKKFLEWIKIKSSVHYSDFVRPKFSEGEIWWCKIGENIGSEMSGKGTSFTRPVLIIKKFSRNLFLGLPTSTKKQLVKEWSFEIFIKSEQTVAILSQARVFDAKRLVSRMGTLDQHTLIKAKRAFAALFYVSPPDS